MSQCCGRWAWPARRLGPTHLARPTIGLSNNSVVCPALSLLPPLSAPNSAWHREGPDNCCTDQQNSTATATPFPLHAFPSTPFQPGCQSETQEQNARARSLEVLGRSSL